MTDDAKTAMPSEKPEHPYLEVSVIGSLIKNFSSRFCPGCGYGIIAHLFDKFFEDEKLDPLKYPLIIGVGCYTQIQVNIHKDVQKIWVLHGRAPAVATGMKMANPELKPIIFSGDGDSIGIGGNHFLHLCRRNIDCVEFIFNNSVYAMTGGQTAPTTLYGAKTSTSPYTSLENRIDAVNLAVTAGASYVARTTVGHPRTLLKYFKKALNHKGTSVIEVVTPCVTYFGRKNPDPISGEKLDTGGKMIDWIRRNTVRRNRAQFMSKEELFNKYVIGEFKYDPNMPEYSDQHKKIIEMARRGD